MLGRKPSHCSQEDYKYCLYFFIIYMDKFTETTTKSYGSRITSALGGIVTGLILFFGAFALLFWNEGRVDMSQVAALATPIDASVVNPSNDGSFVAATGTLQADGEVGDVFVKPSNYIALRRNVKMYAWRENSSSTTTKKVGGSEETTTTYDYVKEWTSSPMSSSSFKKPDGHENPSMLYNHDEITAEQAHVGAYAVSPSKMGLPSFASLALTDSVLPEGTISGSGSTMSGTTMSGTVMDSGTFLSGGSLYIGKGTPTSPQIGDVQISYEALSPGEEVTALGEASGNKLVPYVEQGKGTLYEIDRGTLAEIVAAKAAAHATMGWVWRVVGFLMMWIGLSSILAPLSVVLDVLPFLGDVSRGLINLITFLVALVLSIVTILISMILHNIWAVIIVGVIILVASYLIVSKRLQKAKA